MTWLIANWMRWSLSGFRHSEELALHTSPRGHFVLTYDLLLSYLLGDHGRNEEVCGSSEPDARLLFSNGLLSLCPSATAVPRDAPIPAPCDNDFSVISSPGPPRVSHYIVIIKEYPRCAAPYLTPPTHFGSITSSVSKGRDATTLRNLQCPTQNAGGHVLKLLFRIQWPTRRKPHISNLAQKRNVTLSLNAGLGEFVWLLSVTVHTVRFGRCPTQFTWSWFPGVNQDNSGADFILCAEIYAGPESSWCGGCKCRDKQYCSPSQVGRSCAILRMVPSRIVGNHWNGTVYRFIVGSPERPKVPQSQWEKTTNFEMANHQANSTRFGTVSFAWIDSPWS